MQVFKFGGASVRNPKSVKNLFDIVNTYNSQNIVIVVSAMGKMTNAFERLTNSYFYKKNDLIENFEMMKNFHFQIVDELFIDKNNKTFEQLDIINNIIKNLINQNVSNTYNYNYDQIVSFGEIISTTIISNYLNYKGLKNKWVDIRKSIKTDSVFREAKVDWKKTGQNISENIDFNKFKIFVTQGFIGSDNKNNTTTLGREGSDFTASVLAYSLGAEKVSIWKDVAGVFNADPHIFNNTKLLSKISYQEAIELSYYGAKVIHPKTIKPLQNKNIPLFVKSFIEPEKTGTIIYNFEKNIEPKHPVYIIKENQILISIFPKDFSFVAEESISQIYKFIVQYGIKVNLMQNSALNFSISINNNSQRVDKLILKLKENYKILYNKNLKLITIRHYNNEAISKMIKNKKIFIEQKSRNTAIFLVNN